MFNTAKRWIAKQLVPFLPEATLPDILHGFSGPGEASNPWINYTQEAYERLAITSPLVKPNIDMIGKSFADSTFNVQRPDGDNPEEWKDIPNHKLERLLNVQPFGDMGGAFAKWHQAMWLMLRGEAYWMLIPDGFRKLKYMLPIPAYMIKPMPWKREHGGEPRLISYYAYAPRDPRSPVRLNCENVCYHRLPNPFSPTRGLSPVSPYLLTLKTAVEAEQFDLEDYRHGLTLSKIISLRPDITDRDFLKAKADWLQSALEAARFRVFRGGDVDVKDLSNRRGEEGQNVHKRAEEYAERNWGIPEALRKAASTEASAKVAERTYESGTIMPLLNLLAQDFTSQVLWRYYSQDERVKAASTVPTNAEEEIKQKDSKLKRQTYDEARSMEGLKPHPDPEIGNAPADAAGRVYQVKIAAKNRPATGGTAKAVKQAGSIPQAEDYEEQLQELIEAASNGEIEEDEFKERVAELSAAVLLAMFLLGSGNQELNDEEQAVLDEFVLEDLEAINRLTGEVYNGNYLPLDEGGGGWSIAARVALWVGTAVGIYELAKLYNQRIEYLRWDYDPAKEHCGTCRNLNGKVLTRKEWRELGVYPRGRMLDCNGYRCGCKWTRVTAKAFKRLSFSRNGHRVK